MSAYCPCNETDETTDNHFNDEFEIEEIEPTDKEIWEAENKQLNN